MLRYLSSGCRDFNKFPVPIMERLNWEIYVVAEGALAPIFMKREELHLENGYIWVMPPGLHYGWRSGKAPVLRYAFHFTHIPEILQHAVNERGFFGRKITSDEIRQIDNLYHCLEAHMQKFDPLSGLHIEKALIDLTLLILDGVSLSFEVPLDRINETRVESALIWYRENMEICPTIDAVADAVHVSAGYLRRIFKQVKATSPHELFNELRLAHAKELLGGTSQTLAEISRQCGFSSASDFCRVFSKSTGVSPHKWRNHITREEAESIL